MTHLFNSPASPEHPSRAGRSLITLCGGSCIDLLEAEKLAAPSCSFALAHRVCLCNILESGTGYFRDALNNSHRFLLLTSKPPLYSVVEECLKQAVSLRMLLLCIIIINNMMQLSGQMLALAAYCNNIVTFRTGYPEFKGVYRGWQCLPLPRMQVQAQWGCKNHISPLLQGVARGLPTHTCTLLTTYPLLCRGWRECQYNSLPRMQGSLAFLFPPPPCFLLCCTF